MFEVFDRATLSHFPATRIDGQASETVLSREDFSIAQAEIMAWKGYCATPLQSLASLAQALEISDILYKDEGRRFGLGSFKALGGSYAALCVLKRQITRQLGCEVTLPQIRLGDHAEIAKKITLVSATDGNHGRSLAWGCQRFGAACRIYIHAGVSDARAEAIRVLGAEVIRVDDDYDTSVHAARTAAETNGWFVVSDTSWEGYSEPPRDVMAGYGVMIQEITEALEVPPTHVLLQGGVGGLAAAGCAALRQHWGVDGPRVIVVEPDLAACLFESAKAGTVRSLNIESETLMAGLSCGEPSEMAWEILREEVSDFITVSDAVVGPAMRLLARPIGTDPAITGGESAVAGLAAAIQIARREDLRTAMRIDAHSRVLVIGSEGATDPEIYAAIMKG